MLRLRRPHQKFCRFRHCAARVVFFRQVAGSGAARERLPFARWERVPITKSSCAIFDSYVVGARVGICGALRLARPD
eukprot:2265263-Pyramimonas_sp.AAC.1